MSNDFIEWSGEASLQDLLTPDEALHADLDSTSNAARLGSRATQFGKTVTVFAQIGLTPPGKQWTSVLLTPEVDDPSKPQDWTWNIQTNGLPAVGVGALYVQVKYTLGAAQFTRGPFQLKSTTALRFHCAGGRIQVDAMYLVGSLPATPPSFEVTAGARPGGFADSPLDFYFGQWIVGFALSVSGPGVFMAYEATLQTMSADPQVYLGWYDVPLAAFLVSGTTPSVWSSPPFTAVNQWFSLEASEDEAIYFNTGLVPAWSSTPDVFTLPTGAPAGFFRSKVGY